MSTIAVADHVGPPAPNVDANAVATVAMPHPMSSHHHLQSVTALADLEPDICCSGHVGPPDDATDDAVVPTSPQPPSYRMNPDDLAHVAFDYDDGLLPFADKNTVNNIAILRPNPRSPMNLRLMPPAPFAHGNHDAISNDVVDEDDDDADVDYRLLLPPAVTNEDDDDENDNLCPPTAMLQHMFCAVTLDDINHLHVSRGMISASPSHAADVALHVANVTAVMHPSPTPPTCLDWSAQQVSPSSLAHNDNDTVDHGDDDPPDEVVLPSVVEDDDNDDGLNVLSLPTLCTTIAPVDMNSLCNRNGAHCLTFNADIGQLCRINLLLSPRGFAMISDDPHAVGPLQESLALSSCTADDDYDGDDVCILLSAHNVADICAKTMAHVPAPHQNALTSTRVSVLIDCFMQLGKTMATPVATDDEVFAMHANAIRCLHHHDVCHSMSLAPAVVATLVDDNCDRATPHCLALPHLPTSYERYGKDNDIVTAASTRHLVGPSLLHVVSVDAPSPPSCPKSNNDPFVRINHLIDYNDVMDDDVFPMHDDVIDGSHCLGMSRHSGPATPHSISSASHVNNKLLDDADDNDAVVFSALGNQDASVVDTENQEIHRLV